MRTILKRLSANSSSSLLLLLFWIISIFANASLAQSFSFPEESGLVRGSAECKDLFVGIAAPRWRVRKGREFSIAAVHPIESETKLAYTWKVSNGEILSGQYNSQATVKAGRQKTPGYRNLDGFVSVSLKVTRPAGCSVETSKRIMIGRFEEYNGPTNVDDVMLDEEKLMRKCGPGRKPFEGQVESDDMIVKVTTKASDPENDLPTFGYVVSGGKIVGDGPIVDWDLTDAEPGTYTLIAMAQDGYGVTGRVAKKRVDVYECDTCRLIECPTIDISGPADVKAGASTSFTANVSGGSQQSVTYEWTVLNGEVVNGQGTPFINVKVADKLAPGTGQGSVSVTLKIGGLDPLSGCQNSLTKEFLEKETRPLR